MPALLWLLPLMLLLDASSFLLHFLSNWNFSQRSGGAVPFLCSTSSAPQLQLVAKKQAAIRLRPRLALAQYRVATDRQLQVAQLPTGNVTHTQACVCCLLSGPEHGLPAAVGQLVLRAPEPECGARVSGMAVLWHHLTLCSLTPSLVNPPVC